MGRKVNILTVVGARPQFIKASVLSRSFAGMAGIEESIVHTGQHFDRNMSDLFFEELGIPDPDVNLGISGGSHAEMTARMLVALERVMRERSPDMVLVYGDTNSTLAASLAAAKLHMPLCHAEAGFRTHCRTNPEEVNRICTDHLASLNFAPTPQSIDNLIAEGLGEVSSFTGDLMYDAFQHARSNAGYKKVTLAKFDGAEIVVPTRYVYLTCHREENDSDATLCEVVTAANRFDVPVIYPVHPRVEIKYLV